MHAIIRKKRYKLVCRKLSKNIAALCDAPNSPDKEITICSTTRSPDILIENIIHESLHAAFWDIDEVAIEETARDIARILSRLGVTIDVKAVKSILYDDGD